ncbi:unnamed protein product [Brassica oleracea var. botrytis]
MRRTKKSDLLQKKHADDFFDNVSQVQKEAKIKRRSQDVSSVTRCPERNPPPDQFSSSTKSLLEKRQYLLSKKKRVLTNLICCRKGHDKGGCWTRLLGGAEGNLNSPEKKQNLSIVVMIRSCCGELLSG